MINSLKRNPLIDYQAVDAIRSELALYLDRSIICHQGKILVESVLCGDTPTGSARKKIRNSDLKSKGILLSFVHESGQVRRDSLGTSGEVSSVKI